MKAQILTIILASVAILAGCKKNVTEPALQLGKEYLSINVGNTWTYEVDSITYPGGGALKDSLHFEIKHVVAKQLDSSSESASYLVEVYKRLDSAAAWVYDRSFSYTIDNIKAEKRDQDQYEVILSLPPALYKYWNGTPTYNSDEYEYFISEMNTPFTVLDVVYDSSLVIDQENQINLITEIYGKEVYSKNIGLIYKKRVALNLVNDPSEINGTQYTYRLISYEK